MSRKQPLSSMFKFKMFLPHDVRVFICYCFPVSMAIICFTPLLFPFPLFNDLTFWGLRTLEAFWFASSHNNEAFPSPILPWFEFVLCLTTWWFFFLTSSVTAFTVLRCPVGLCLFSERGYPYIFPMLVIPSCLTKSVPV